MRGKNINPFNPYFPYNSFFGMEGTNYSYFGGRIVSFHTIHPKKELFRYNRIKGVFFPLISIYGGW